MRSCRTLLAASSAFQLDGKILSAPEVWMVTSELKQRMVQIEKASFILKQFEL